MHVNTYGGLLLILCVWTQTGSLVRAQDCQLAWFTASDRYDSNFDTSGLRESYLLGSKVRVPCHVGYVGSFWLLCLSDVGVRWGYEGLECQPKSCGHPGDADDAKFQLVKGDDFVYGSEVEYTCEPGYQMVSRINRRRCEHFGWDGVVPVCEAKRCPEIHVDDDVHVTGELLEATSGHVLLFRCKQRHMEVDGAKQIYCEETGQWSGQAPKCKERTCEPPGDVLSAVLNGTKADDYALGSAVQYSCKTGYRMVRGSGRRRCTLNGWEWDGVEPRCEIIRCPVIDVENNVRIIRANRNATPGHVLGFSCTSSPDLVLTGPAQIRCKENGEWSDRPPTCKACNCYLGVKNDMKLVSNDQMTASSVKATPVIGEWLPHFGRLDEGGNRNAWRAATDDQRQWLQVDLGCSKTITGIITQGDGGYAFGTSYVTRFRVSYSDDGGTGTVVTHANGSEKIFDGNVDSSGYKRNVFEPPVTARYVRVLPRAWNKGIALRMELLGCETDCSHAVQLQNHQQRTPCVSPDSPPPETCTFAFD